MNPFHLLVSINREARSRYRNIWFKLLGVQITGYVWMRKISIPRNWNQIVIESGAALEDGVILLAGGKGRAPKIRIGASYINRFTILDAQEMIQIGSGCLIGPFCYITDSDHGTEKGIALGKQPMKSQRVVIEDRVWIGAGVSVLKGVRIGKGAVVGAGAVVTADVPENSKIAGVPARVIGESK